MSSSSGSGLMRADDPLIIKRRFIRPMPPVPISINEKPDKKTKAYQEKLRKRFCLTCTNTATQQLCLDCDGAIKVERYCDECIKKQNV